MTLTPVVVVNDCGNFHHLHQINQSTSSVHHQQSKPYYEEKGLNTSSTTNSTIGSNSRNFSPMKEDRHGLLDYKYIKTLGRGSYGRVELYEQISTGELVAIKLINKNLLRTNRQLERVRREVRILTLLEHPHIIQLKQVIETNDSIFMILEYVPHGELFEFISSRGFLTNMEGLVIFRQLISALAYCHTNCIIHRDLKPENILLSSDLSIKVADFGFGAVFGHVALLSTFCGSPHYAAPEMLTGIPYSGPEVDIWSVGVILHVLLTGKLPTSPLSFSAIHDSSLCESSTELIKRMLTTSPESRATLSEILSHPWVTSVDHDLPHSFVPYREVITLKNLNQEVFSYLCQSGYDKENILQILLKPDSHPLKAEYYLLIERKKDTTTGATHNYHPSTPCKNSPVYRRASVGQLGPQDRSSSPVKKLLTRMSSMFTSTSIRNNDSIMLNFSLLPDKSLDNDTTLHRRRSSMPTLPVLLATEPNPFNDNSFQYQTSSYSFNSRGSLLAPRRVVENSSIIYLGPTPIYLISSHVVSFLNDIGMIFSVRDSRNPFKLWCENRQKEGEFPPLALTIEVVEIINVTSSTTLVYGLECRRLCGGSWVVFRRLLTQLGKHMSVGAEEIPLQYL